MTADITKLIVAFLNRYVIKLQMDCFIMTELIKIFRFQGYGWVRMGSILKLGGQLLSFKFICKHISKSLLGLYSKQTNKILKCQIHTATRYGRKPQNLNSTQAKLSTIESTLRESKCTKVVTTVVSLMKCDAVLSGRRHHSALMDKAHPCGVLSTNPHGVTPHSTVSSDPQLNVTSIKGPISPVLCAASNYIFTNSIKPDVFLEKYINTQRAN